MTRAARIAADLAKFVRLARDVPPLMARPMTLAQARRIVAARLARREEAFLWLCEHAVFANPRSPYRRLLAAAGCELGDLRALVVRQGLEPALATLLRAGVYLTFDEFKGRRDVVRGSLRMTCAEDEFDNPLIATHLEAFSGGTRSAGTTVKLTLPYLADLAADTALALEAHGLDAYEHAIWLQGFAPGYTYAMLGRSVTAWFHQAPLSRRHRAASRYIQLLARLAGRSLPPPHRVDVMDPEQVADWVEARRSEGRRVCVTTYASSAVRICLAAAARGRRLDHAAFVTLGEPFTATKASVVASVGARALVRYAFTEAGIVGYGCGAPHVSDDVHFAHHSYGLVQRTRAVSADGPDVDAFLFTSLLATAPKVLLNVESGDYGVLERCACDCSLGRAGLDRHLSTIRSFEKLSSEGMTFVQTDLLRVLEERLPARCGGTGADYQVLEEEDDRGILRLLLLVSPVVKDVDVDHVRQAFLEELGGNGPFNRFAAGFWERAGTVEVRRQSPVATRAGKILPFHLISREPLVSRGGPS